MSSDNAPIPNGILQYINEFTVSAATLQDLNEPNQPNQKKQLSGKLWIHKLVNPNITGYRLYWGDINQQKLVINQQLLQPIKIFDVTHQQSALNSTNIDHYSDRPLVYDFTVKSQDKITATELPDGAKYFLLYATYSSQDAQSTSTPEKRLIAKPIIGFSDLLPLNATPLENNLAASTSRIEALPVNISNVWDLDACPDEFLPWLAWAQSTETWIDYSDNPEYQDAFRRQVMHNNIDAQKYKGTKQGIKSALEDLGISVNIVEWFEPAFKNQNGKNNSATTGGNDQAPFNDYENAYDFEVMFSVRDNVLAPLKSINDTIHNTIDALKPVRSSYTLIYTETSTAKMLMKSHNQAYQFTHLNQCWQAPKPIEQPKPTEKVNLVTGLSNSILMQANTTPFISLSLLE